MDLRMMPSSGDRKLPTKFVSHIVMLKRLLLFKESLLLMIVSDKWPAYRDDDQQKA
jgi:hypothetical protein